MITGFFDDPSGGTGVRLDKLDLQGKAYNAFTGKLTDSQRKQHIEQCAINNFRINKGRYTLDQERARCAGSINSILDVNDKAADDANPISLKNVMPFLIAGGLVILAFLNLEAAGRRR
jgi:hypothetical protein